MVRWKSESARMIVMEEKTAIVTFPAISIALLWFCWWTGVEASKNTCDVKLGRSCA